MAPTVAQRLEDALAADTELSLPVAGIVSLTAVVKDSQATTMSELMLELDAAIKALAEHTDNSISLSAGCELFLRFVTRTSMDVTDFQTCRERILESGQSFIHRAARGKQQIARQGAQFIQDGMVILIHSYSRMVLALLQQAAQSHKRFTVYVTESRPSGSGFWAARQLQQAGIPVSVVRDCAVAFLMGKVDLVLSGAEGVVESGGIINQIGTYQVAMVARASNTPFYVVVESYKFVRLFPLNQYDLPSTSMSNLNFVHERIRGSAPAEADQADGLDVVAQSVDYTPPEYITLLFTDLGVLTPSAVSDELIKLYY